MNRQDRTADVIRMRTELPSTGNHLHGIRPGYRSDHRRGIGMGIRSFAAVVLGVLHAGGAFAQTVPINLANDLPPLELADPPKIGPGGPAMPGVIVSHALQAPVETPPP